MVFDEYARFYDALYRDKDYRRECRFVQRVFEACGGGEVKTVLDLGCGTGSHALILADMGYAVTGVDLSPEMLRIARAKAHAQGREISFRRGDIRRLALRRRFDAVLAMFNVIGYQTSNRDVSATIRSARRHLPAGGLFIFDVWFGPAVLAERPSERVKDAGEGASCFTRRARPVLDILNQTVAVNYTVLQAGESRAAEESHLVRFFFYQELRYFLEGNGFELLQVCPFLELQGQVDEHTWNISVVARGV